MRAAALRRVMAVSFFAIAVSCLLLLNAPYASAIESPLLDQSCKDLFGLPTGTITTTATSAVLDKDLCDAYRYLINRYSPGPASSVGLSNPRVQGITKLNPAFAKNLAKVMRAGDQEGLAIRIGSAYRTCEGQQKANPNGFGGNCSGSLHTQGRAVDFVWSKSECSSAECKFVQRYTRANKELCISFYNDVHRAVAGEANHVEDTCNKGEGPGGGTPVAGPPSNGLTNQIRRALGMQQQPAQMPPMMAPISYPQQQMPSQQYFPTQPVATQSRPTTVTTPSASTTFDLSLFLSEFGTSSAASAGATTSPISTSSAESFVKYAVTLKPTVTTVAVPPPAVQSAPQVSAQQTFSGSPVYQSPASTTTETLSRILSLLSTGLRNILSILQPHRGKTFAPEGYVEEGE